MSESTIQFIITAAMAIGVVIYAVAQWRNGRTEKTTTDINIAGGTIDLLQKSVDVLRAELVTTKAELLKEHDEIIRLQESLKHKDDQIKQYLDILQNRNPEMDAFMKYMTEIGASAAKYMDTTSRALVEMQAVLQKGTLVPMHQ